MSSYSCNEDLLPHVINNCNDFRRGGSKELILLDCGVVLSDPSDLNEIESLISQKKAVRIDDVKIEVPDAEAVTVDSPIACEPPATVNFNRTLVLIDGNVNQSNVALYNQLNFKRLGGILVIECGNQDDPKAHYYRSQGDNGLRFQGTKNLPVTDQEFQVINGTFSWLNPNDGSIFNAPA